MKEVEKVREMGECKGFWFMQREQWDSFFKSHADGGPEDQTATMSGWCARSKMPTQGDIFKCEFMKSWIWFEVTEVKIMSDPEDQYFAKMFPVKSELKKEAK